MDKTEQILQAAKERGKKMILNESGESAYKVFFD